MRRIFALLSASRFRLRWSLLTPRAAIGRLRRGSLPEFKTGPGLKIIISSTTISFVKDKTSGYIPASAITEISYGQDVIVCVGAAIGLAVISLGIGGLMALTKPRKHYVGLPGRWRQKGRPGSPVATRMTIGESWLHSRCDWQGRQSTPNHDGQN